MITPMMMMTFIMMIMATTTTIAPTSTTTTTTTMMTTAMMMMTTAVNSQMAVAGAGHLHGNRVVRHPRQASAASRQLSDSHLHQVARIFLQDLSCPCDIVFSLHFV